jgi:tetratricopeptide (TPR) repeat protein
VRAAAELEARACSRRVGWLPGALVVFALLAACNEKPAPDRGAGGASLDAIAATSVPQRTTRGDIALRNLSGRIASLEKRAARGPLGLSDREQLVESLLTRTQFAGSFGDFERALELGESAVRDFGKDAKAYLLRARTESAVHRFEDAVKDLDAAARLGVNVDARLASIRIAEGHDLERARAFAQSQVARAPTLEHLGLLANAEAALGEFEAADEHYAAALATLRDVTPFPVAQLCFQRGVMWAELAARPERALPHYAEAVRRLPGYVVANVHLAELEASLGRRDAAIERLRSVVDRTADPEPAAYLAQLLAARDPKDPAAAALIGRARVGYEGLLTRHRLAFLDHAAEFFGGSGNDPALASRLAEENLLLRQTPRAYALAIEAAFRARQSPLACRHLDAAHAAAGYSQNLAALLERESPRCATR